MWFALRFLEALNRFSFTARFWRVWSEHYQPKEQRRIERKAKCPTGGVGPVPDGDFAFTTF